ncbi:MAG: zinc-finger domain-containing protein [Tatlockia sp.]|nr:zinc-finger domain-containing protein [Tatlockia sp.]
MPDQKKMPACTEKKYLVHACDLPLSCPTAEMTLWNAHPKVYLPIEKTGAEICPYCGSKFVLE